MKEIILTQGKIALVDDEDYERVNQYKWSCKFSNKSKTFYAKRVINIGNRQTNIYLHRFILKLKDSNIEIDHEDRNGLNNQKYNLRECTHEQNMRNAVGNIISTSKYKGVSLRNNRYVVQISIKDRTYNLGLYDYEKDAAAIYDAVARYYSKEFAYTNFKEEYVKPLSIEKLKEKYSSLKPIMAISTKTGLEVFRGTYIECRKKFSISPLYIKDCFNNCSYNNIILKRIKYKLTNVPI